MVLFAVSFQSSSKIESSWTEKLGGRKVNTVSADDVECVRFQHWPEPPRNVNRFFKLRPCQVKTS
jgi:hypothetical protein